MKVGFIVDHPKRDLASGLMLAAAFARHNVETVLIPMYEQATDVPLLGLSAVIVNFARMGNLELVRRYTQLGIPVWVLDTEGGILADDGANSPRRLASFVRDSGFGSLLAGYFFWGSHLQQAFIKESGMHRDQLHITGCPRFDYAAPSWRNLLEYKSNGYILFNANFPLVNPRFVSSPDSEVRTLLASGWAEEYVGSLLVDSKIIMRRYLETVRRIASRYADRKFIIRPHPFEDPKVYVENTKDLANIVVDGSGGVLNVIHSADCVLHLNCGTAIEAVLLGKVPLSMEFLNTPFMSKHSSLPSRVSLSIPTEQALFNALDDLKSVNDCFPFGSRHAELIHPWFHNNDGKSSNRIADVVVKALERNQVKSSKISLKDSLNCSREDPRSIQRLQALFSNMIGSRRTATLRAVFQKKRRDKQLLAEIVAPQFRAIDLHSGCLGGFTLQQAKHPITGLDLASLIVRKKPQWSGW